MLTTQGKNIILRPYQTVKSLEIGKSTATDLTYAFAPSYDTKSLVWNNPNNNQIRANQVVFTIPAGGTPNLMVASNKSNYTFGTENTGTYSAGTQYFDTFEEMLSATPTTSSQTARIGKKFATTNYNFILKNIGNIHPTNLIVDTLDWLEFDPQATPDEVLYQTIYDNYTQTINDDIAIIVRINGNNVTFYYLVMPIDISQSTKAYPTTALGSLKVVYPVADHQTEPMTFVESSTIKINEVKINIGG
jgi:hypothetical protein